MSLERWPARLLLLVLFMALQTPIPSYAEKLDCAFQNRGEDIFFARLPKEIKGWIKCPNEKLGLNLIFVARIDKADREAVVDLFMRYERISVEERQKTLITKETGSVNTELFLEFQTLRGEERMTHFVSSGKTENGSILVFIYTDTNEAAQKLRLSFSSLQKTFLKKDYLRGLSEALRASESVSTSQSPSPSKKQ